jgi:hypothetical protein
MTLLDERGFEILLEEPPSAKSLWAALVTSLDPTLCARLRTGALFLACSREKALADARAHIETQISELRAAPRDE